MVNRVIFALSLLGIIVTLHLWVQKARDFDKGCWGVGKESAALSVSGCTDSKLTAAGELMGVSVAVWGYFYFLATAVLTMGKMLFPSRPAERCNMMAQALVLVALPYCCYLLAYQAIVAKAFCPLCLVCSAIIITIFILHVALLTRRIRRISNTSSDRLTELGYASGMIFIGSGVLVALLMFVDNIGTRRLDQGSTSKQFEAALGRALPRFVDMSRVGASAFNQSIPMLKTGEWVGAAMPAMRGTEGISIIAFLDPNCPACEGTYSNLAELAERYDGRAAFYVFPRILWDKSILQVQALELAKSSGKYYEMWDLQFQKRKTGGMRESDIYLLFAEMGLGKAEFEGRLLALKPRVIALSDKARDAGVRATPTIFLNGKAVASHSLNPLSISKLIEDEEKQKTKNTRTSGPNLAIEGITQSKDSEGHNVERSGR